MEFKQQLKSKIKKDEYGPQQFIEGMLLLAGLARPRYL